MNPIDLATVVFTLLTYGLVAVSVGLWIQIWRRHRRGLDMVSNRFRWKPVRVPAFAVVVTLALLLPYFYTATQGLFTIGAPAAQPSLKAIRMGVLLSLAEGCLVITVLLLSLFLGVRSQTELVRLGFHNDRIGKQFRDGAYGFVASLVPVFAVLLVTSPLRSDETVHPFLRLLKETGPGMELVLIILTAAVVAPLKEELMFRVIFQSWLEEYLPAGFAVLLSSLAFAFIHGIPDSLALVPLALILGYVYQRRRSYLTVVTIHALFNSYNLLATFLTD